MLVTIVKSAHSRLMMVITGDSASKVALHAAWREVMALQLRACIAGSSNLMLAGSRAIIKMRPDSKIHLQAHVRLRALQRLHGQRLGP